MEAAPAALLLLLLLLLLLVLLLLLLLPLMPLMPLTPPLPLPPRVPAVPPEVEGLGEGSSRLQGTRGRPLSFWRTYVTALSRAAHSLSSSSLGLPSALTMQRSWSPWSLPGKTGERLSSSPRMQPTDHTSTGVP